LERRVAIEAVIFDMDGVLIDSEELWREAEAAVFRSVGIPMTAEDGRLTMGLRSDEVVEYWYLRHPWTGPSKIEVDASINRGVIDLILERGGILPGAVEAIELLHAAGYPLGLASSSSSELIGRVVDKLGVRDKLSVLQSAEHEPYGKPHPAVYIEAARRLGIAPDRCLAIEDSPAGLLAAKAARMSCIVVPAADMRGDRRFCIADGMMNSLDELSLEALSGF
jgi:mannitol-1-/sugar-/sorbitol-6-/2-deoxyglucose-6-phosphatase